MIRPLRLKAVDDDDLEVIAACLQDALIPLSEMVFSPDEQRFLGAFTRFRRECLEDPNGCDGMTLTETVLAFNQVETVKHHGVDPELGRVKLELLTILSEPTPEGGRFHVTLLFAGDAEIRLTVGAISATLEDFGEPWAAPASPTHALLADDPG